MAALLPEHPLNDFTLADWKEALDHFKPGGSDVFSRKSSEATLVGYIPASKSRSAIRYFTGWSQATTGTPWKLLRHNPPFHPRYPWMRSVGVSLDQFGPVANPGNILSGAAYVASPQAGGLERHGNYLWSQATVHFSQLPYPVWDDGQTIFWQEKEYLRNCNLFDSTDAKLETLMADTEPFLKAVETWTGGPSNVTPGHADQTAFPGTVYEFLTKVDLVVGWFGVTADYLLENRLPKNLLRALGTVNRSEWLNYPAGVLKVDGIRMAKYQAPVWSLEPYEEFDVFIGLSHFDPPLGVELYGTTGGEPKARGWNTFPWSRSGGWGLFTRDGQVEGARFLPLSEFDDMFKHAGNPDVTAIRYTPPPPPPPPPP